MFKTFIRPILEYANTIWTQKVHDQSWKCAEKIHKSSQMIKITKLWKTLPYKVVNAKSINNFKYLFDKAHSIQNRNDLRLTNHQYSLNFLMFQI